MHRFSGTADPSALKAGIRPGVRRLAHHLFHLSFRNLSLYCRPRSRKVGVFCAMVAVVAGGFAGWFGPIELVILLVISMHVGIAYLIAGPNPPNLDAPIPHMARAEEQIHADGPPPNGPHQHRLLRLAARAIDQGQLTQAAQIYHRAIRECKGDADVQTIAQSSLANLDLSEKIVKNAQT